MGVLNVETRFLPSLRTKTANRSYVYRLRGVDDEFNKMALDQSLEGTIRNRSRGLLHEPMMPSDDGTKKPYRKTCRA